MILGIDIGRKRHYTVIIGIDIIDDIVYVKLVKALHSTPFDEQMATIRTIIKLIETSKVTIDASGIGMHMAENLKKEFPSKVNPVVFNNENKHQMMSNLRILFEHKKIRLPDHRMLINSLHKIQRKSTGTGLEKYDAQEDDTGEHGDYAWALALACYSQKKKSKLGFYGIKKK